MWQWWITYALWAFMYSMYFKWRFKWGDWYDPSGDNPNHPVMKAVTLCPSDHTAELRLPRTQSCKTPGTACSRQNVSFLEATRLWRLWPGGPKASSPFLLTLAAILKVHPSLRAPRAPTKASVSSAVYLRLNPRLSDPRGLILETISFYREISFISEAVSEKIQLMIQMK